MLNMRPPNKHYLFLIVGVTAMVDMLATKLDQMNHELVEMRKELCEMKEEQRRSFNYYRYIFRIEL